MSTLTIQTPEGTPVGTITGRPDGTFTATVNGYSIDDTYPDAAAAAQAVVVTATRAAAL
jgi:hypothetical protein